MNEPALKHWQINTHEQLMQLLIPDGQEIGNQAIIGVPRAIDVVRAYKMYEDCQENGAFVILAARYCEWERENKSNEAFQNDIN